MKPFSFFSSRRSETSALQETEVFRVFIPDDVRPGEHFQTMAGNRMVLVECPPGGYPGQALSITVPKEQQLDDEEEKSAQDNEDSDEQQRPENLNRGSNATRDETTQLFEVAVPSGVQPGTPFSLIAGGQRILVTCPLNAREGDKIRFQVPKELLSRRKIEDETAKIRLQYNKDGWARNVRLTDMKFQWVRMDDKGDVDLDQRFDIDRSAYVRTMEWEYRYSGAGVRRGFVYLVPAADAVADSWIKGSDGSILVSYNDIAEAQVLSFDDKVKWFHSMCDKVGERRGELFYRQNYSRIRSHSFFRRIVSNLSFSKYRMGLGTCKSTCEGIPWHSIV